MNPTSISKVEIVEFVHCRKPAELSFATTAVSIVLLESLPSFQLILWPMAALFHSWSEDLFSDKKSNRWHEENKDSRTAPGRDD